MIKFNQLMTAVLSDFQIAIVLSWEKHHASIDTEYFNNLIYIKLFNTSIIIHQYIIYNKMILKYFFHNTTFIPFNEQDAWVLYIQTAAHNIDVCKVLKS